MGDQKNQNQFVAVGNDVYQCSQADWAKFLAAVRDQNIQQVTPDLIRDNQMFVKAGNCYNISQLSPETATGILNGLPYQEIEAMAEKRIAAGAVTGAGTQHAKSKTGSA